MIEAFIGLVGVLVGSFIIVLNDIWTSHREIRKDGSYAAIRLISILETYADRCIDVVQDDGTFQGRPAGRHSAGDEYCEAQEDTPAPLQYPEDIEWRSLDEPLMHRILALPNKARQTNRYIHESTEYSSPPYFEDYFDARQEGYARLGAEALNIISDLRKRFRVSVNSGIHMASDWDPAEFLSKKIQKIDQERAQLEKRRSEAKKEKAI